MSAVIDEVVRDARPSVVTKHGVPVAEIVALPRVTAEDRVQARAARHVEEMAEEDRRAGRTRAPGEVVEELRRLAQALARRAALEGD